MGNIMIQGYYNLEKKYSNINFLIFCTIFRATLGTTKNKNSANYMENYTGSIINYLAAS